MTKPFSVCLVLLMLGGTNALAENFYVDAINVNYGTVTGVQATVQTPSGDLAGSWNNILDNGPSAYGGAINSDGYGGIWEKTPITALGVLLTNLQIQVNNGGWGNMYFTAGPGGPGTLEYEVAYNASGAAFGNPNHWNWYVTWQGIPTFFNNYNVYALNDGAWFEVATNMNSASGNMPLAHPVVVTTAALQFLQLGDPPPPVAAILIVR